MYFVLLITIALIKMVPSFPKLTSLHSIRHYSMSSLLEPTIKKKSMHIGSSPSKPSAKRSFPTLQNVTDEQIR